MAEGYTLERLGSESESVSIGSDCVSEECTKTNVSTRNSVCNYDFPFDDEARRPERAQSKYESPYRILYHPQCVLRTKKSKVYHKKSKQCMETVHIKDQFAHAL